MEFLPPQAISLKTHPQFNEKWLQQKLTEDPALLGLGDLVVKDVERRQLGAGRLDILLSDPESLTRYEVEIQLGSTDESHVIRTIEYWDLERRRYPQYDHVAVIVAEDITSRFLNVISLFNGFIPLVAIQIQAVQVGQALTLVATKVVDVLTLGTEEEDEGGGATDRTYWETDRGSAATVQLADRMLQLVRDVTGESGLALKYNKFYIGLAKDGVANNFVQFRPRRKNMIVEFRVPSSEDLTAKLDDDGLDMLDYAKRWGRYRARACLARSSSVTRERYTEERAPRTCPPPNEPSQSRSHLSRRDVHARRNRSRATRNWLSLRRVNDSHPHHIQDVRRGAWTSWGHL